MGDIARGLRGNDINDFRLDPLSSEMHRLYRKRIIQTHLINWFDLKPLVRHLICASVTKAITVYMKLENNSTELHTHMFHTEGVALELWEILHFSSTERSAVPL